RAHLPRQGPFRPARGQAARGARRRRGAANSACVGDRRRAQRGAPRLRRGIVLTVPRPVKFAHAIVLAWGWRRAAIAFVAGAVSTLALAPFNAWPVLFLTFPVLVWLVDGAAAGRLGGVGAAALAGWWFGFGYFLAGLYWIGFAFLVDA